MAHNNAQHISLADIKAPLAGELDKYEEFLKQALHSESPYFNDILQYIFDNRGKGVRPTLVMLFAGVFGGGKPFSSRVHLAASLIELIHTASLVHDDIIDNATVRHGQTSVNSKWGGRNAILTGDFILSRIFEMGMESLEFDILTYVSHSIKWLCEGEVIQDEQTKTLAMTHERYYDIIDKKTASLLGISCGVGALAAKAPAAEVDKAYHIGRAMGMAFQIKDDILDYATTDQTGKPTCADLREHKITLPLLEVMKDCTPQEVEKIKAMVRRADDEDIAQLRQIVAAHNGAERAEQVMNDFLTEAKALLADYPDSPYRTSLYLMCDFLAQRKK